MKIPGADRSGSGCPDQAFYGEGSTVAPSDASDYSDDSDEDSEWSFSHQECPDEEALAVRRRLRTKTKVNNERSEGGVPVPKQK